MTEPIEMADWFKLLKHMHVIWYPSIVLFSNLYRESPIRPSMPSGQSGLHLKRKPNLLP